MINITFIKDYSETYNIKFDGLKIIDIEYIDGKVNSIKLRNSEKNYLKNIEEFKNQYEIETDDVITIVDMYFANEYSIEYIGKGIFELDKVEKEGEK